MPRTADKQPIPLILDNTIVAGKINFLYDSKHSAPLLEQPWHGARALAATGKYVNILCYLSTIPCTCEARQFIYYREFAEIRLK